MRSRKSASEDSRALTIVRADAGRESRSFSKHCMTSAASVVEIDGLRSAIGAGRSIMCAVMYAWLVRFPGNGCAPVRQLVGDAWGNPNMSAR